MPFLCSLMENRCFQMFPSARTLHWFCRHASSGMNLTAFWLKSKRNDCHKRFAKGFRIEASEGKLYDFDSGHSSMYFTKINSLCFSL
jgi:hypothetical protein